MAGKNLPVPGFVPGFKYPRVDYAQQPITSAELMKKYHANDEEDEEYDEYTPKTTAKRSPKRNHVAVRPKTERHSRRYLDDDDDEEEEEEYIPKPTKRRSGRSQEIVQPETPAEHSSERYHEEDEDDDEEDDEDEEYIPKTPAGRNSIRNPPAFGNVSQDEIKTEEEEDISYFMESARDTFLKVSSKELTLKAAADILGRPYSFVYSRYQEFCDNVTGKVTPEKKKKTSTIKRSGKKKRKKKSKWSYNKAKTTGKIFKCEDCPGIFNSESKIKNHSKVHSGNIPTHTCTACGVVFAKLHYLMRHRIEIHEEALQCPHCDSQFTVILKYNKHIKSHTGVRPFICKECGQGFFSKFHLEAHFRKHTGERPFMCGLCEKTFTTLENLKSHSNIHKEVKPYPCDECDERFNSKTGMERHKVKHTGVQPYKCDLCPAAFYQKKDFEQHGIVHTGLKAFKCDLCDFSCTRQHTLKYHKYEHTGEKPFKCDVYGCTAEYTKPQSLKHHKLKHGVPPCNVCHEKFPDLNSLKHHMTIHTGEKPRTCEQCLKVFYKESALKRHMYSHMDRPAGSKSKRVRQNKINPVVNVVNKIENRQPINTQKIWSSEYQVPVIADNEHSIVYAPSLNTNIEETYSQVAPAQVVTQVTQQLSYPFSANQYSTLINNAWPSTMDPEEVRRRLLSSFK